MSIAQPTIESRKISELKNWEDNPRSITGEDFDRLKEQIKKLGAYKPLLVNQDNIVLGGNMRLRALKELGVSEIVCSIVQTKSPSEMLEYALSDNDQVGVNDDLKLAELITLNPIQSELYKVQTGNLKPIDSVLNPDNPYGDGTPAEIDESTMDDKLETYLNGSVKQITLIYENEEYGQVIAKLEDLAKVYNLDNNTEIITKLINEAHEKDISTT